MKKRYLLIAILAFVICLSLCLVACNGNNQNSGGGLWQYKPEEPALPDNPNNPIGPEEPINPDNPNNPDDPADSVVLTVPTGLAVSDNGLLSWKRVSGAKGYDIEVNGTLIENRRLTSFSLLDMENLPADGVFTAKVRAVNGDNKTNWSEACTYNHVGRAIVYPSLDVQDGAIVWSASSYAKNVSVKVNGTESLLDGGASSYSLSNLDKDSTISVQFIGDGVYNLNSKEVKVLYKASTSSVCYPVPENIKMDGATLKFDEVLGASVYYLKDVNNTVTTLSELESDRSNKFLVKAVWAGNPSLSIQNSDEGEVEYFASEKGNGSKESPFLISTPAEMRYIDYYESVNKSMHYKLVSDIILEVSTPKNDEVFSNFYNIGSFSGVLDGNGYALKNTIVYYRDGYSSIFDSIAKTAVIKNLVIDNATWRTWTVRTNDGTMHEKGGECSILAYTNRGLIENVKVTASNIHAVKDGASGLVSINKGIIKNCSISSDTTIFGANEAGGIAIFNNGTIEGCTNYAKVEGGKVIGGIVARNNGIVTKCGNEGDIFANTYGGGIVGYNFNIYDNGLQFESSINLCYNKGNVSVKSYGGGIAGKNGSDGINEVGVMSYANAEIKSCYNLGKIHGANGIGGIVGDNYGYNEKAGDLGVTNCYNQGEISTDLSLLEDSRVYLDISQASWATDYGAVFYLHFWAKDGTASVYPGVKMTPTTIGTKTYYYADMSVKAEDLTGIKLTRYSPDGSSEWNRTEDIALSFTGGKLCFMINLEWTTATPSFSSGLVNSAPLSVGGIAGFNNMINDCYYMQATIDGKSLEAGLSSGTQYNKIILGGKTSTSTDCQFTNVSDIVDKMNAVNDVWVLNDGQLILKWQQEASR